MKLDLEQGRWAELREGRITYGQAAAAKGAMYAASADPTRKVDVVLEMARLYLTAWNVTGEDGEILPIASLELAPDNVVDAIGGAALDLWKKRDVIPKAGRKTSSTTPRALRSA